MSHAHPSMPLCLVVCLAAAVGPALAQTPATASAPVAVVTTTTTPPGNRTDQRIEHIRIEDTGSRIDELRVGGETQSITVSPKGGMPAYEVVPDSANRGPATLDRNNHSATGGTRVWKILGF